MQLEKARYKVGCELGACRHLATRTVRMERTGVRAALHVCDGCLKELHALIGRMLKEENADTTDVNDADAVAVAVAGAAKAKAAPKRTRVKETQ